MAYARVFRPVKSTMRMLFKENSFNRIWWTGPLKLIEGNVME